MTVELAFFAVYYLQLNLTGDIFAWTAMIIIWCLLTTRSYRFFWAFTTPKKGVDIQERLIEETVGKSKSGDDSTAKPLIPERNGDSVQAIEARLERLEKKHAAKQDLAVKRSVLEVLPSGEKKETQKKPQETVNFMLVNEKGLADVGREPARLKSNVPTHRRSAEDEIAVWRGDSLEIVNPDAKEIKFNDEQASSMLSMLNCDAKNKKEYREKRAGIKNFLGKNRLFNWTNLILAAAGVGASFLCRQAMPGYYILSLFLAFLLPLPIAMLMHKLLGR